MSAKVKEIEGLIIQNNKTSYFEDKKINKLLLVKEEMMQLDNESQSFLLHALFKKVSSSDPMQEYRKLNHSPIKLVQELFENFPHQINTIQEIVYCQETQDLQACQIIAKRSGRFVENFPRHIEENVAALSKNLDIKTVSADLVLGNLLVKEFNSKVGVLSPLENDLQKIHLSLSHRDDKQIQDLFDIEENLKKAKESYQKIHNQILDFHQEDVLKSKNVYERYRMKAVWSQRLGVDKFTDQDHRIIIQGSASIIGTDKVVFLCNGLLSALSSFDVVWKARKDAGSLIEKSEQIITDKQ